MNVNNITNILNQNDLKKAFLLQEEMAKQFQQSIVNISKLYNQIDFDLITKHQKIITENFIQNQSNISEIIKSFNNIRITSKIENEIDKQYLEILIKANWPPVICITYPQIKEIIKEYKAVELDIFVKELDEFFIQYLDEKILNEMFEKWKKNDVLKNRIKILESIIKAHIEKNYILSVPVMLIQIEGFIGNYYNHNGQMKNFELKEYIKKISDESFLNKIAESAQNMIEEKIYTRFEWGTPGTSEISRHAILHGALTDYDTELNSLKAIVLFNFIVTASQSKNNFIKKGDDKNA
jgi:hypothetical protein